MKKLLAIICLMLFVSGGCNYIAVTGGRGGDFDATSFTVEYGGPPPGEIKDKVNSESGKRDWMLTGGTTIIDNADYVHPFAKSSPEIGSFIKLGIEVVPDTGFFANMLGGVTFIHWSSIWARDQVDVNGMFGGGLTYFINDKNVCLLTAYDNRRGFTAGVGLRF